MQAPRRILSWKIYCAVWKNLQKTLRKVSKHPMRLLSNSKHRNSKRNRNPNRNSNHNRNRNRNEKWKPQG